MRHRALLRRHVFSSVVVPRVIISVASCSLFFSHMRKSSFVPPLVFDPSRRQVFVVGNEAADCDSLVSAYVCAADLDNAEIQAIAVALIAREDFRLRGDAVALFRMSGSELLPDGSPSKLIFWDELDCSMSGLRVSCALTDHNKMNRKVRERFGDRVDWILDHHASTDSHPDAVVEIDERLGSTCSLVTERVLARGPISAEWGILLAGVILLDTRNFDPKQQRFSRRDEAALKRLESFIPACGATSWFDQLYSARRAVSHLSVRDMLRLDLKVGSASDGEFVAFSSFFCTLPELCQMSNGPGAIRQEMESFVEDKGYEAVVGLFPVEASGRRSITFVPRVSSNRGVAICNLMVQQLQEPPSNVLEQFRQNPLFEAQGITECGFGLVARSDLEALQSFTTRADITRKTLMPYALSGFAR